MFSKCASTIPDGKRLENLSWRVWARETLCCPPQPEKTIVPAIDIPLSSKEDVPSLSNSYESDSEQSITSLENSALSKSRGTEPHLTPSALEKIISNIQEQQKLEPLDPEMEACLVAKISPEKVNDHEQSPESDTSSRQQTNYTSESSCLSTATNTTVSPEREVPHRNSDTSVSSDGLIRSGSVVHGFSPIPSLRSRGNSSISKALPVLAKSINRSPIAVKKAIFTMGGSSEDDDSSFDQNMSYRRSMLQPEPRKSSLSTSQTRDDRSQQKKTTSFREEVEQRTIQIGGKSADDNAIESDDDDDEEEDSVIDDSAIEEDEEEWEDEQPEEAPVNPVFKRVDSAAHLPSRRSILTAGLTEGDRAKGLLNAASQSSPAIRRMERASSHTGPLVAMSPDDNDDDGPVMMRPVANSRAININSQQSSAYALAQSPRTTRRNMLSTELTESLRKNLLWERQQKNTTVNAFLKREARSMANLQRAGQSAQQAGPPHARDDLTRGNNSYNDYFNVTSEYHTKGW